MKNMYKMLTEVSNKRKGKVWERNNISLLLFSFFLFIFSLKRIFYTPHNHINTLYNEI